MTSLFFHTVRIRAGDKIDSKVFSFYKSHHFSEIANWLLFIKGSKFVLFVDIYPWSWVVKHSHISNWRRYGGHLCPSFSIQRYVYCNILQSRIVCIKEVFLAGGCFLNGQWTSFTSEESRPRGNSSVSKCWTGLCSVLWWSWFELWTCTLPPLESAAGFVQVGIQRHLFGYPGAGPGSWKRIASTVL